jgi:hypothetical protein
MERELRLRARRVEVDLLQEHQAVSAEGLRHGAPVEPQPQREVLEQLARQALHVAAVLLVGLPVPFSGGATTWKKKSFHVFLPSRSLCSLVP